MDWDLLLGLGLCCGFGLVVSWVLCDTAWFYLGLVDFCGVGII